MMTAFLLYIGKVAVLLAVFYLFYRLLLDRETFHRLNRAVLLLSVLAAFILPLCEITLYKTVVAEWLPSDQDTMPMELQPNAPESGVYSILTWLFVCYIIGVAAKLIHTTVNIFRIHRLISHCEHHMQSDGTDIAVSPNDVPPFSWWNTIVFSRRDYDLHDSALLTHERAHINGYHSVDILLMEMVIALQWFNPAAWLIGRELRNVHEYEADASVLSSGIDTHHYLTLLMERGNSRHTFTLANSISQKALKSRFQMMARRRSKPSRLFKVLYVLPVIGITLALNARTIVETQYVYKPKAQPTPELTESMPPTTSTHSVAKSRIKRRKATPAEVTVSGTVVDEAGHPIIGTIVAVRDGTLGTVTDYDGNFSIVVPQGATLDFKYIGVATESVTATQDVNQMTITLKKDDSDKE